MKVRKARYWCEDELHEIVTSPDLNGLGNIDGYERIERVGDEYIGVKNLGTTRFRGRRGKLAILGGTLTSMSLIMGGVLSPYIPLVGGNVMAYLDILRDKVQPFRENISSVRKFISRYSDRITFLTVDVADWLAGIKRG